MKKLIIPLFIILFALEGKAQFLNSVAITAGVSAGNQKFFFSDPAAISRKRYVFGFNASFFAEFFSYDHARWVSEIQFNQKGSLDRRPDVVFPNKLQYLSWNNYLKLRYEMYSIIPYVLVGPRLEYKVTQAESSPEAFGPFLPLHLSAAVGAGVEFVNYYNFKFFTEAFYNPDLMSAYVRPGLHVQNKNFELRVGLKLELAGRKQNCNTPTYVE